MCFSLGRYKGSLPAVDRRSALFEPVPKPAELGRAARAALEAEDRDIYEKAPNRIRAATGYNDDRALYNGIGWVTLEQFDDAGRDMISEMPNRVDGRNILPHTEEERVLALQSSDATLGKAILELLKQTSRMNTRADARKVQMKRKFSR